MKLPSTSSWKGQTPWRTLPRPLQPHACGLHRVAQGVPGLQRGDVHVGRDHHAPPAKGLQAPEAAPGDDLARLPAHPQDRHHLQRPTGVLGHQRGGPARALAVDHRVPVSEPALHQLLPLGEGPPGLPRRRLSRVHAGEGRQRGVDVPGLPEPPGLVDRAHRARLRRCRRRCRLRLLLLESHRRHELVDQLLQAAPGPVHRVHRPIAYCHCCRRHRAPPKCLCFVALPIAARLRAKKKGRPRMETALCVELGCEGAGGPVVSGEADPAYRTPGHEPPEQQRPDAQPDEVQEEELHVEGQQRRRDDQDDRPGHHDLLPLPPRLLLRGLDRGVIAPVRRPSRWAARSRPPARLSPRPWSSPRCGT